MEKFPVERKTALMGCMFSVVLVFFQVPFFLNAAPPWPVTWILVTVGAAFTAALFLIAFFIRKNGYLLSVIFILNSFICFYDGESTQGVLLFLVGICFLVKCFFFRKNTTLKIGLMGTLLTAELAAASYLSPKARFSGMVLTVVFLIILFAIIFFLFKNDLYAYFHDKKPFYSLRNDGGLSESESVCVRFLLQCLSTKEIAEHVFRAETTVRTLLSRSYAKMGVRDSKELIKFLSQFEITD